MTNTTSSECTHGEIGTHRATVLAVGAIWEEVLQQAKVEADANFFSLGGDSIMMMMVLFRIGAELGVELPPAALVESPTLDEFCTLIDSARETEVEVRKNDGKYEEGIL